MVQNDEWNSTAAECITTDGHAQFTVASSAISGPASGDPGGYPSIYSGCSAGVCTTGNKLPIRVGRLKPGMITSSWVTTQPADGAYDVAYDIWFNRAPVTSGAPDGGELMIWLAHRGGSQIAPAGAPVAHVAIGGYAFTLWLWTGKGGQHRISYVMDNQVRSVRDLDVSGVAADAARRGYLSGPSYLLNVQAGFEIWQGGRGLGTESFALSVGP
jgi:cellulose 1,4-beta-cellobiosidase